ncbi:DUF3883 domain-containing protein [Alloiococcus sp. CFN-8]|uniref:DUF3883 domain-containing protein n=1 Tax=Alloiococcus sp. CFN-8 TaxID=3416081 RepID=UPI003CE7FB63
MNDKMYDSIYKFYKENYGEIEKHEIYKWKAVKHFQDTWDIDAVDFSAMLDMSLKKTSNLMSAGNYYPRRMIKWAAIKEPEIVRLLFRNLYDLSTDVKYRIKSFRDGISEIVEKYKEGSINKSYQDDRAIMVYLNLKYPEKYYLYKYTMFVKFANLIDYADLPDAGDIALIFMYESMCDMILKRVMEDEELLKKYESRRSQYYDPGYHLLVQDIVYSANYFAAPEILEHSEKKFEVKKFELQAENKPAILKGVHVDYIEEAKRNKEIGDSGEEYVYQYERLRIKKYKLGKNKQVQRIAKIYGDGLGYDILSYDEQGHEIYIEVKTTSGPEKGSIYITSNELKMSEENSDYYYLYRVYDFDKVAMTGKLSIRKGSLKELCISAQTYKVDFK